MLTNPKSGWTDFKLEGTSVYGLSYLDDIVFEWLDQAIHGLKTLLPFCVKGYLEPNRFLCTVSYWNCHVICEDDERFPLENEDVLHEISHTNMLEFCQYLYDDVSQNLDEWISFVDYQDIDVVSRKAALTHKLAELKNLITEREVFFAGNRCFL